MIGILDYGIGNLGSIKNMLRKIGSQSVITSDPQEIRAVDKLILPGVGAFDTGMEQLAKSGLVDLLHERALEDKIPVLGICLGAQLMTKGSEEGSVPGLGWFDAETVKFDFDDIEGKWHLPNIGWREVVNHDAGPLLANFDNAPRFYFVHSYYMRSNDPSIVSMTTQYAFPYHCGLRADNLHCVQFHPEKSHRFGMQLLRNFAELA